MSVDASKIAMSVLVALGGSANVVANSTCMTRLRITLADSSLMDRDAINSLDGVLGCVERGVNGIEVVFGPASIEPVFEEFARLTGLESGIEPLIGSRRATRRLDVHISPLKAAQAKDDEGADESDDQSGDEEFLTDLPGLLNES